MIIKLAAMEKTAIAIPGLGAATTWLASKVGATLAPKVVGAGLGAATAGVTGAVKGLYDTATGAGMLNGVRKNIFGGVLTGAMMS